MTSPDPHRPTEDTGRRDTPEVSEVPAVPDAPGVPGVPGAPGAPGSAGSAGSEGAAGRARARDSLARERAEVIAALGRLADDSFGRCDVCGVQISDRRLRLAPALDRCIDHLTAPAQPDPRLPASRDRDTETGETA